MTGREPPRLALALLARFAPDSAPLAGDLIEEFNRRQSRSWFWWQVLAVIVAAFKQPDRESALWHRRAGARRAGAARDPCRAGCMVGTDRVHARGRRARHHHDRDASEQGRLAREQLGTSAFRPGAAPSCTRWTAAAQPDNLRQEYPPLPIEGYWS